MENARFGHVFFLASLVVAAAVAACGRAGGEDIRKEDATGAKGVAPGDGTTTPGSRLVPLTYRGSDGSKAFAGLFDKQIGKECAFERMGALGVCVPPDLYTVDIEVFSNSLKTASPALYLDPSCDERTAIALDEGTDCAHYGVIRLTSSVTSDYPACGRTAFGTGLAVVTPIPAGTKVYAFGQGGGQCCTCKEWVAPEGRRAYRVEFLPDETSVAAIKLVTATIDSPL